MTTIRLPSGPMPRLWFVRLFNAVQDGNRRLERRARRELAAIGVRVVISRSWRKGVRK